MSEEREGEQAGAPVEPAVDTETQLLAAVERAAEVTPASEGAIVPVAAERPEIAVFEEPPSAGQVETAEEIFAAHTASNGNGAVAEPVAIAADPPVTVEPTPQQASAAGTTMGNTGLPPERDGEIRVSADHPMAALYMQTPMSPDLKGNRGAGVFIGLLATVVFAIVYAGAIAAWQAAHFPPSTFLEQGLLPWVLNWSFAAASLAFFVGFVLLVLIFGKAGWWAYVLGGLLVAALVWAATVATDALLAQFAGENVSWHPYWLATDFGLTFPAIAAALVAREVSVWFGAWVGARGRKVKRQNAEALAEYEASLAEAQAKTP